MNTSIQNHKIDMKEINFRKIRNNDIDSFKYDICNSDFYKFDENTRLEEMVDTYDTVLKSILNKHAPIIKKKIYSCDSSPWFNNTLLQYKHEKRRAEERYKQSNSKENWQTFKHKLSKSITDCNSRQTSNYSEKFASCNGDLNKVYKLINSLINHDVNHDLYPEGSNETIASRFGNFFQEKIHKIKYEIETTKENDLISETCDDH